MTKQTQIEGKEYFIFLVYTSLYEEMPTQKITPAILLETINKALKAFHNDPEFYNLVENLLSTARDTAIWQITSPKKEKSDAWKKAAKKWRREAEDLKRKLDVYRETPARYRGGR